MDETTRDKRDEDVYQPEEISNSQASNILKTGVRCIVLHVLQNSYIFFLLYDAIPLCYCHTLYPHKGSTDETMPNGKKYKASLKKQENCNSRTFYLISYKKKHATIYT